MFLVAGLMRQITDFPLLAVVSVRVCTAAYEFRIMMDGRAESREQETVYTTTPYVSIHLPLMRRRRRWGSGMFCWCPSESWVIHHVESEIKPHHVSIRIRAFLLHFPCLPFLYWCSPSFSFSVLFSIFLPSCYYFPSAAAILNPPPCSVLRGRHPSLKCCSNFQSTCSRVCLEHAGAQLASAPAGEEPPTPRLRKSSGSWSVYPVTMLPWKQRKFCWSVSGIFVLLLAQ